VDLLILWVSGARVMRINYSRSKNDAANMGIHAANTVISWNLI
jgi:hypothetical protein